MHVPGRICEHGKEIDAAIQHCSLPIEVPNSAVEQKEVSSDCCRQVLPDMAKWEYMGAVPLNGQMVQLWQLKEKCVLVILPNGIAQAQCRSCPNMRIDPPFVVGHAFVCQRLTAASWSNCLLAAGTRRRLCCTSSTSGRQRMPSGTSRFCSPCTVRAALCATPDGWAGVITAGMTFVWVG